MIKVGDKVRFKQDKDYYSKELNGVILRQENSNFVIEVETTTYNYNYSFSGAAANTRTPVVSKKQYTVAFDLIIDPEEEAKLEQEFLTVYNTALKEIDVKIAEAYRALKEAEDIADKYGVPFRAEISPISNSYTPKGFEDKWKLLSKNFVADHTDVYDEYGGHGWAHSAVC